MRSGPCRPLRSGTTNSPGRTFPCFATECRCSRAILSRRMQMGWWLCRARRRRKSLRSRNKWTSKSTRCIPLSKSFIRFKKPSADSGESREEKGACFQEKMLCFYRHSFRLHALLLALTVFCTVPACTQGKQCGIRPTNYKGWDAQEIRNEWVRLTIVPRLGGRLMQVAFGPHEYLFVNKEYEGKYLPPLEPDAPAKWYNYGGDKIWPLPEGRHDDQHWPGPMADALDDGDYAFSIVSQETACRVRLDGPPDLRTGLQYSREISLQADSP